MIESTGPIGKIDPSKPIKIIGAGISGLLMGYYLKKSGHEIQIIEKAAKEGGKISTIKSEYGLVETAANAIFTNSDVLELIQELNLEYYTAHRSLKKFIWRNGPKSSPISFLEALPIFFKLLKKISPKSESLYHLLEPLLGHKLTKEVAASALIGVYATDIEELHSPSILKSEIKNQTYFSFIFNLIKKKKKQKHKAASVSFKNGMQDFINALKFNLYENITTSSQYDFSKEDNILICTDALCAGEILKDFPKVAHTLSQIKYTETSSSTLISKKQIPYLQQSFGILFPPCSEFKTMGILSNSEIFPGRSATGEHSYTFITQGCNNTQKIVEDDLKKIDQEEVFISKVHFEATSWKRAIPIYDKSRYDSILKLRSEFISLPPNIALYGNYIDSISIREIVSTCKKFAHFPQN